LTFYRERIMGYINRIHLYVDGGSKGNPGQGAIGVVICDESDKLLHQFSASIGHCTNNQAEYRAVIRGLDLCAKYTRGDVYCFSDSELVVKQIVADYRLINDDLRDLFHSVKRNEEPFENVFYQKVPRNHQRIAQADRFLNEAYQGRCTDRCVNQ
jgi:ribonuclease HI